ncbi:transglycosylase SLT domain-containing protein [Actinomadura rayongensis]|uniref:Transglycosylase SLT domain-containing protein n=1 Tax=Actinomadura rayongensis TaxID=1429076 RepID=A0A6I4WA28_9ACTN|nr:transglycosylase SLT domain-containing protein [Actinomadura rayongensis]
MILVFVVVILVPLSLIATPQPTSSGCSTLEQPSTTQESQQIPTPYLKLYREAGEDYGIPWTVIAGIGKIESDHGRSNMKGVHAGENYAGAGGPMQFLKDTWEQYGVDGNHDGRKIRYDPEDAIPSAANYLRASGAPTDLRKAIYAYNHLDSYVSLVLSWANKYGRDAKGSRPLEAICTPSDQAGKRAPPGSFKRRSPRVGVSGCKQVTRALIDEVDTVLGPYTTIGCARPGDPQDHGTGHAADLMLSSGGRAPSGSGEALGNRTADYVIANYQRLQVKYVIWQQRIWNPSICKCWRHMEDRGSITQNHFDHVHVSVLG